MSHDKSLVQVLVNALEIHEKSVLASWGQTIVEAHATSCAFCWALRAWRAKEPITLHPVTRVPKEVLERWPKCCPGCGSAKVYYYGDVWTFDVDARQEQRGPEIRWCPFCGTKLKTEDDL